MNVKYKKQNNVLTVEVVFEKDDNQEKKVNTSDVMVMAQEKYDIVKYKKFDTIVNRPGERVKGVWEMFLADGGNSLSVDELKKNVSGVGKKTAEELLKKYKDADNIKKALEAGEITGLYGNAEENLKKYLSEDE